jgi:hypothetical protein
MLQLVTIIGTVDRRLKKITDMKTRSFGALKNKLTF